MDRIEQTIKKNGLKLDQESINRVDKTIRMYEKTSKVRHRKEIKELKEVKAYIKANM